MKNLVAIVWTPVLRTSSNSRMLVALQHKSAFTIMARATRQQDNVDYDFECFASWLPTQVQVRVQVRCALHFKCGGFYNRLESKAAM